MNVLFVCTGNTCRSAMAEAMLRQAAEEAGVRDLEVSSAGIGAWEGAAASEGAFLVMLEQGLDLSNHRARLLTREMIDESDLILTMARSHLGRVREMGGGGRVHLLGEFAGGARTQVEVRDPYGSDLEQYRDTQRELADLIPGVLARLSGEK